MDELEKKAVEELKSLIGKIEAGEYNISECGYDVHVEETNISTDEGAVTHVLLQYNIKHTIIE
ncbi:hypothetical protein [Salinicoccus halitifaciens]|uniref:Deoxycytidine triphosphate deaminase n=1 Tax=Salinicoccus halitifaciens TaxID=1073415 RepID=A0ABV2E6C5_9STAP|nr:hypothetical protein [Salinicoccus halitifaciens]MCD2137075.1 hypothetical protein [Salinicoccus halitifaciens]